MKRLWLALIVVACVAGTASRAAACGGNNLHSGLPWFGYGYSGTLYGLGHVPVPPYYALHPPVHYSDRIATPYGSTPFARNPNRAPSAPQIVINPFVPNQAAVAGRASVSTGVIVNPFYQPEPAEKN